MQEWRSEAKGTFCLKGTSYYTATIFEWTGRLLKGQNSFSVARGEWKALKFPNDCTIKYSLCFSALVARKSIWAEEGFLKNARTMNFFALCPVLVARDSQNSVRVSSSKTQLQGEICLNFRLSRPYKQSWFLCTIIASSKLDPFTGKVIWFHFHDSASIRHNDPSHLS